ncbi:MAG: hypothetical protein ACFE95_12675 [Candidatus Hodarchaeota archaeon]
MSEPIKYTYRGLGGFLVIIAALLLGIIGVALVVVGVIITILSWFPVLSPEFLSTYQIFFLGERITDPSYAFMLFFVTGLTLIALGTIILGFIAYFYRFAQVIDQDIFDTVDSKVPSIRRIFTRKSKGVFVLLILLFGTIAVFLQILLG